MLNLHFHNNAFCEGDNYRFIAYCNSQAIIGGPRRRVFIVSIYMYTLFATSLEAQVVDENMTFL